MPRPLPDTSFLFSLYGNDAHTGRAREWVRSQSAPIALSALSRYEFGNAVRFAAFRKAITADDAARSLENFAADLKSGYLQVAPCDLAVVVAQAMRLSEAHTLNSGHRSFDILHIATAKVLRAAPFLSFDQNQRKLATAERLEVAP